MIGNSRTGRSVYSPSLLKAIKDKVAMKSHIAVTGTASRSCPGIDHEKQRTTLELLTVNVV